MAVEGSFLQAGSYSAEVLRRTVGAVLQRGASIGSVLGGLVASTDLQIKKGSGAHVEVSPGEAFVPGSTSATQSGYYYRVTTEETKSVSAADPTNPRVDRVVAVAKDKAYTGAEDTFTLEVLAGTPTAGATLSNLNGVAAAPASSLTLGYSLMPAAGSTPSEVKNVATLLVPGLQSATYREGTAAERPAAGVKGRIWYATDTHSYSLDTGSEWHEITPPSTNKYSALTARASATPFEPSATRDAMVVLQASGATKIQNITVGGVVLGPSSGSATTFWASFRCPAGQKWEATCASGLESSYLLL